MYMVLPYRHALWSAYYRIGMLFGVPMSYVDMSYLYYCLIWYLYINVFIYANTGFTVLALGPGFRPIFIHSFIC